VLALFLAWQGVPQTLQAAVTATGVEVGEQIIARGPAAT
jgi:K+-transporting ATPase ATPase A chain